MNIARMPLPLFVALLAMLGSFQSARAQWAFLKASLQGDVNILEETATRLVLCRQDSTATVIVTIKKGSDSDIFGGVEVRRGSNPYRVWVTTENFVKKPHLAGNGAGEFFQSSFVKTLRTEEAAKTAVPTDLPAEPEAAPETSEPAAVETLAEEAQEPEPPLAEIKPEIVAADTLRETTPLATTPAVTKPSPSHKPVRSSRKNRPAKRKTQQTARSAQPRKSVLPPASETPAPPVAAPAVTAATLDSLYQFALAESRKENWKQAVVTLEEIQSWQPDYRDVAEWLAQARLQLDLAEKKPARAASQSSGTPALFTTGALAAIGAFVALILLPMIGVIYLSTSLRARYHMFRGNHAEAAQLFERKLARRPGKTKLYAELANAYLLLGRRDDQALRVYKMVLQLKLDTKNREALNAIVAQSYLAAGRAETNMIEVLENALKAERRRLGQGPEKQ